MDDQGGYPEDSETHLKIFIGADHRGFELKNKIAALLSIQNYEVVDVGTFEAQPPCDYPKISYEVAHRVAETKFSDAINSKLSFCRLISFWIAA